MPRFRLIEEPFAKRLMAASNGNIVADQFGFRAFKIPARKGYFLLHRSEDQTVTGFRWDYFLEYRPKKRAKARA
jgi:hypothetical protein